ncbi:MAG: hypothetical protein ACLP1X_12095 [Polyangiaceae bacterium]
MADPAVPEIPDTHTLRRIAVEAHRDPRVVRSVLLGREVTATSRAAVSDAVRRLGLAIVVPSPTRPEPPPAA